MYYNVERESVRYRLLPFSCPGLAPDLSEDRRPARPPAIFKENRRAVGVATRYFHAATLSNSPGEAVAYALEFLIGCATLEMWELSLPAAMGLARRVLAR